MSHNATTSTNQSPSLSDDWQLEASLRNAVVTIVDDDRTITALLERCLLSAGYRRVMCYGGLAAARAGWQSAPPDLVILDLQLPDGTGDELLDELTGPRGEALCPIIMLTADERSCPRAELLNQGASDIIAKPFDPREILAYVRSRLTNALTLRRLQDAASRALLNAAPQIASRPAPETKPPATARTESTVERERLQCELARVQAAWSVLKLSLAETQQAPGAELSTALRRIGEVITPALSTDDTRTPTGAGKRAEKTAATSETGNGVTLGAHTDPWVDRAALLARCMNKEALATKLIAQFCDELPEYVAQLTAALESADAEDLRQTAHKLKGASANLCVWPINKLAIQLEANGRENDLAAAAAPVGELGTISKQLVTAAIQSTTSVQELDRWR